MRSDDPTRANNVTPTRLSGLVGSVTSFAWFSILVRTIWLSHQRARTWDGVVCCDPLEDIGALYLLVLVLLALAAFSMIIARRPDNRGWAIAVAVLYLPFVLIMFNSLPGLPADGFDDIIDVLPIASGLASVGVITLAVWGRVRPALFAGR